MRRLTIAFIALAVALTACTPEEPSATTVTVGTNPIERREPQAFSLVAFDACEDFLSYVKEHALELVTPWGLGGGGYYPGPFLDFAVEDVAMAASEAGGDDGGRASSAPQAGVDYSTTNIQEVGVDEPDIVKTDGRRIVALSEQTLYVVDVTGSTPELLGSLPLGDRWVSDMFLHEDTVLLLGANWGTHLGTRPVEPGFAADIAYPHYESPTANLVEVDISDPADMEIVRNLEMDGRYVNARLVGDTARVVVNSNPTGFVWEFPEGGGLRAERTALEANKEIIRNSTIDNWVPYFILSDGRGDVLTEGNLLECSRASHPVEFSGIDMLNVVTIDLSNGLDVVDTTGVLASGETVYASTDSLYVATQRWVDWAVLEGEDDIAEEFDGVRTAIHQFDISDDERTEYVASGEITGFLLNQFAMSEHDGNLRVASTTTPNWWGRGGAESESLVTVLSPEDGVLETIGSVGGLGKGEQIYSVRFMGDTGYVVTFRQTDPLYTIDLSDPTDPKVLGELKIMGYSAYLHPISDDLLLGIGQDADDRGRIKGTQVSLFDVEDLSNPVRIDQVTLDKGSNSTVEYDHRAFLHWAATGLTVLPIQSWGWDEGREKDEVFFGAIGVDVDTDGDLELMGEIVHPGGTSDGDVWDWRAQILRSVVVDGSLYTVSAKGILKSDLNTLSEEAFVGF